MNQHTNKDFEKVVADAALSVITPEAIQEKVAERAEALMTEAVNDALRSYGPVGKVVKQSVEDALQIKGLDLPSYGEIVMTTLSKALSENVAELIEGRLKSDMQDLLKLAPKSIKLSEIAERMVEGHYEYETGRWGDIVTVGIRYHGYDESDESCTIWLDGNSSGLEEHEADVRMHVYKGKVLSVHIGGRDITKGTLYGLSGGKQSISRGIRNSLGDLCLALYACQSEVIVDEDSVRRGRDEDY